MEFPNLGEHCQKPDCNQTDFLPLQCKCGKIFCREHFNDHCLSGECELAPKPKEVNLKNDDQIFKCSEKGCRKGSFLEMLCPKCGKHFCIEHRFHPSCPEIDDETLAKKIEEIEAPKRQFNEVNKHLQEKITENIRKALQTPKIKTALKIHLMRIKQKALGPKTVTPNDRVYFSIKKPQSKEPKSIKIVEEESFIKPLDIKIDPDLKDTYPVFISTKWSLGRSIDSISETLNIVNENNKMGCPKLKVFRQLDGYCVSPCRMEEEVQELISQGVLVEGDKLVLEYVDDKVLSSIVDGSQVFLEI